MNVMFKEIRSGDIEKVRARIAKNPEVVNEIYTGKKPLKDIAQSPLQVAIKCGQFEIIDLLLENGADPDFMEDQSLKPEDTSASYFVSMSVLHDAIIGVFGSVSYGEFERAEKTVKLIEKLLEMGADPNKKSSPFPRSGECRPPIGTLVIEAGNVLHSYSRSDHEYDKEKYKNARKLLFDILELLKKYGADFDEWFDGKMWNGETYRSAYLDEFVPKEDEPYEYEYKGRIIKAVRKGDVDSHKEIRAAFREFFKVK